MRGAVVDACGCFPTGRHYPGIAHLLKVSVRGVADEFSTDAAWDELTIALVDLETTGFDLTQARIVEVGIVIGTRGEITNRFNWLVNPGIPIPEEARSVHGISDEMVKDQPTFAQVAHEIAQALEGCVPAAYNATFDRSFLHGEFARARAAREGNVPPEWAKIPGLRREVEWLDPLVWARDLHAEEKSRALGDVAERLGVKLENAHRAKDDAEAALRVFYALGRDPRVPRAYGALVQEQRRLSQMQADMRRMWRN